MKNPLWKFINNKGVFIAESANQINTLYLPLCNALPFMSSITPDLHGDIKTNNHFFLLEPASRIDLSNSKASRNFWIYISPKKVWSCTGVSKDIRTIQKDKFSLEAGLLWQRISRKNTRIGLKSEITSFVPANGEPVEIMRLDITNISSKTIKFIPTAAIPIYGRSANNLRDHRHVSSLLHRIQLQKFGVILTPILSFDESGHNKHSTAYFVLGIDSKANGPEYIYPTREEFTGTNSDLEAPNVILNNLLPDKNLKPQGKEAIGALRFKAMTLKPGQTSSYIILLGIAHHEKDIPGIWRKFNTPVKVEKSLELTKDFWQKKSSSIQLATQDKGFDNWFRWMSIQPLLRKIFGCSFLPDFDYGRGGRGWRDLWQDSLSLILTHPEETRGWLINNFSGVRIDGSNATIIGQGRREFVADRNNIARVWMDHGIWPLMTTLLYIHQTGDLKILLEKTSYFRDRQLLRSHLMDWAWSGAYANKLKTKSNTIYQGTILEHILLQNLVQFFNVGPHNHIRLEGADWNDGLDMAAQYGESVAFTALYAQTIKDICCLLEKLEIKTVTLLKEMSILLDSLGRAPINYSDKNEKQKILGTYFNATKYRVAGRKISISVTALISDLMKKSDWITQHIRKTEWLRQGFYNGYYDNKKMRVEGNNGNDIRMTLAGQVFPVMSGVATDTQIPIIFKNVKKYLRDKRLGGFRLNTDFRTEQLNLGRAFSFIYGDKENGAFFNHMIVMFAYALYKRGFAREGFEVINSVYKMAADTDKSKIFPCLPEYFNSEGRGMYCYLTGSASWYLLTFLTETFGIRGNFGDFIIEPKLTAAQFRNNTAISIAAFFAGRRIEVKFINLGRKDFSRYSINKVSFNQRVVTQNLREPIFTLPRNEFLALANRRINIIEVELE